MTTNSMRLQIITPEKTVFSEEVDQVTLMTKDGEITVLPHHIPLVSLLQPGELRYLKNGVEYHLAVSGGFAEVRPDGSLAILADTAEHAAEIDLVRAQEAHDRAAKLMSEPRRRDEVDYAGLQAQMEKALARLKVGNKYRKLK